MKPQHRILDGMPIGDIAEAAGVGGNTSWQTLALVGEWRGHWMGPFSISEQQIQQMADHIKGSEIDVVVDYEHATLFSDKAPASGWVKDAQVDTDQNQRAVLVAQIAWVETAAEHIRKREYRYLSPVIRWNTRDRQTGADAGTSIQSVALTNVPFLHELPEVRLNSFRAVFAKHEPEEPMNQEQFEALCMVLGLDPKSTPPERALEVLGEAQASAERLRAVTAAMGIEEGQQADPVEVANQLRAQATALDANDVASLRQQVTALTEAQEHTQALAAVKAAQGEGKVAGDGTDNFKHALAWAKRDLQGFTNYMATLAPFSVAPGHVQRTPATVRTVPGAALTDEDAEMEAQVQRNLRALGISQEERSQLEGQTPNQHLFRLWGAIDAPPVAQGGGDS